MIRVFATVLGVLAFAVGVAGLVSRYLPIDNEIVLVVVAAASPYLTAGGVIAMIALALAQRWVQPLHYFRDDLARFPSTLREVARDAGAGAVIVAGDLNSTIDMQPFRKFLAEGYRDARGAGRRGSDPHVPE